jgi:hypothetical protein
MVSLLTIVTPGHSAAEKKHSIEIDSFSKSDSSVSSVPPGWHPSRDDISMFFIRNENSNQYVRIDTKGGCTSIGKQFKFSPEEYPLLSWKWRINKVPKGGNESIKEKNDSAAGVYVIFKGKLKLNHIIKYVWSSTLPKGTVTKSPYNSRTKVIVLKSGISDRGKWLQETVNIQRDYKILFDKDAPPVEAIGLLSDSDNTDSFASADYDDIKASSLEKIAS